MALFFLLSFRLCGVPSWGPIPQATGEPESGERVMQVVFVEG